MYKVKIGEDGSVKQYKAKLVVQSYTQLVKYFDESFCPIIRLEFLRMLIAKSVYHGLQLHQLDVAMAFLNGTLDEDVFMKQPKG